TECSEHDFHCQRAKNESHDCRVHAFVTLLTARETYSGETNVTVPESALGSSARSVGINGRVSASRFDGARSTITAIEYFAMFCWCTMLLSIVTSTSNRASTALARSSPFSIPVHPISGTDST